MPKSPFMFIFDAYLIHPHLVAGRRTAGLTHGRGLRSSDARAGNRLLSWGAGIRFVEGQRKKLPILKLFREDCSGVQRKGD